MPSPSPPPLRDLNDYESMLATSTCNVGMSLTLPRDWESKLREAWTRTRQERRQLQVKLEAKEGDSGPLGQRYTLTDIDNHDDLLQIQAKPTTSSLLTNLQRVGTTTLDITKGSYVVVCWLDETTHDRTTQSMQVIISVCHALSDGPGALRVARSFLEHLGKAFDKEDEDEPILLLHPLINLQAMLLGSDHCKTTDSTANEVFVGQDIFSKALGQNPPALDDGTTVLPVEAMQAIPTDAGFGSEPSVIDCAHFSLTAEETTALRLNCREHGTTIQGALVAAALKARLTLLGKLDEARGVLAAVQIPVNTRSMAPVDDDVCLCGSAGVWHTVTIPQQSTTTTTWWEIAKDSTQKMRAAIQDTQPVLEWLRRLLHAPATLPPYSLMVSSIGVAPIKAKYGPVSVNKLHFFGASLRTPQPSKAVGSMIHAVTFRDELHCLINFTSPGIARAFAESTASKIKETLISFLL